MKTTLSPIVLAAALMLACHAAAVAASPAVQKMGSSTKPITAAAPYELKLSLISDFGSQQSGIPKLRVSFVNATRYALSYYLIPRHTVTFQVEYKTASDDPGKQTNWKRLTPVSTSIGPNQSGVVAESDEHVELERMRPGEEDELYAPSTFSPLLKEGFYRITATLTAPNAGEFRGTVSPSTLVRSFNLVVSSKPLVIRRTATGFAEVPPITVKPLALIEPYQLNLSLSDYRSASPDAPYIALNIANMTQNYLLLFIWRSAQDVVYKVEYKASADDPHISSGWKDLKPDIKAVPSLSIAKPSGDDGLTQSSSYAERFIIKPGQTGFGEAYPPDVPLAKQGFYRITAVVTVPEAREFNEPASNASLIRIFTLTMHSLPFVIQRTATGVVEVPATASVVPAH